MKLNVFLSLQQFSVRALSKTIQICLLKSHRKRNLNQSFADRKPFYLRLKHVLMQKESERVNETTEEEQETTVDSRLIHLMILYVHKDKIDAINLVDVV